MVNLLTESTSTLDFVTGEGIFGFAKFGTKFTIISVVVGKVFGLEVKTGNRKVQAWLSTDSAVVGSSCFVS